MASIGWARRYSATTIRPRAGCTPSPSRRRPIVHIEDISSAFIAVLAAPPESVRALALNIGRTNQNFRIRELAEIVRETVPGCEVTLTPGASPDTRNRRVDFTRVSQVLPLFSPRWDPAGRRDNCTRPSK